MGDWDAEIDAWTGETSSCTRCGEDLVRHEAIIGSWLTDGPVPPPRVRGLCPDGEPHTAGDQQPEPAELRVRIHRHLKKYPRLTVHDLGRVLGAADSSVRHALKAMEADGEAKPETTPKTADICRPVTRWTAT